MKTVIDRNVVSLLSFLESNPMSQNYTTGIVLCRTESVYTHTKYVSVRHTLYLGEQ
jgi:hypothetical protein